MKSIRLNVLVAGLIASTALSAQAQGLSTNPETLKMQLSYSRTVIACEHPASGDTFRFRPNDRTYAAGEYIEKYIWDDKTGWVWREQNFYQVGERRLFGIEYKNIVNNKVKSRAVITNSKTEPATVLSNDYGWCDVL